VSTAAPTTVTGGWLVDRRYQWPPRFLASFVGLAAVLLLAVITSPGTFNKFSLVLITGPRRVSHRGEALARNLVVMAGSIDLAVPAIVTLGGRTQRPSRRADVRCRVGRTGRFRRRLCDRSRGAASSSPSSA